MYTDNYDGRFCPLITQNGGWDACFDSNWQMNERGLLSIGTCQETDATNSELFQCPEAKDYTREYTSRFAGYGYNECLGNDYYNPLSYGLKITSISAPSKIMMNADAGYFSENTYEVTSYLRAPLAGKHGYGKNNFAGTVDFRHNGSAAAVYVDLHTAASSKIYTAGNAGDGTRTGFLSADNSAYEPIIGTRSTR